MTLFSVTERGTFKRCPRQWRLSSRNGQHLGPIVAPVYLSVGTLIHKGSQHWLLDDPAGLNFEQHVTVASSDMIERAHAKYKAQVGVEMSAVEDDVLYESIHFARAMAQNYEIRWGSALPEGFRLVRPEQRAVVPVPGTEHRCPTCQGVGMHADGFGGTIDCPDCAGAGVQLHHLDMRFDGLLLDDSDRLHILERKTYKNRPKLASLQTNDQFLAYMWGAEQLGVGEIAGIAYDGLWRRDAVPKRNATFEDLFLRVTLTRTRAEFNEFAHMLPLELNDMYAKMDVPFEDLWFNRRWEGCYDCAFGVRANRDDVCRAISRGEKAQVEVLLKSYYAPRDDDTEDEEEPAEEAAA